MTNERTRVRQPNPDKTAPQLVVEVNYEIRVEQYVDIVAYFSGMDEHGRARFVRWVEEQEPQGYGEDELVLNYLLPEEDDFFDVGAVGYRPLVSDSEQVDVDYGSTSVRLRQGYTEQTYGAASEFTEEDFEYLLSHVPWLKTFFEARAAQELEQDPSDLNRIPGPNDISLFTILSETADPSRVLGPPDFTDFTKE